LFIGNGLGGIPLEATRGPDAANRKTKMANSESVESLYIVAVVAVKNVSGAGRRKEEGGGSRRE